MQLTQREAEVLRLLAPGRSYKSVARELGITVQTVKNHVHNAKRANGIERTDRLIFLLITEDEPQDKAA